MGIAFLSSGQTTVRAATTIEDYYKVQGPWAVSTATAVDGAGLAYHLWYPTNLGAGGYDHPILSWGNGTGAVPTQYADTLDHLASWGYVVIAQDSGTQGLGNLIVAGANYMKAKNIDSGSIFYQKLNTNKIGAFGHSQGAGGALNAIFLSPGTFKSAFTSAVPNTTWWSTPVPNMLLWPTSVPVWFTRGVGDTFIATESQATTNWYNKVPGPAAKATLKGTGTAADHNAIQTVNNKYQGYLVAWFKYTLESDSYARGAFVGTLPELNTNNGVTPANPAKPGWQNQVEKKLGDAEIAIYKVDISQAYEVDGTVGLTCHIDIADSTSPGGAWINAPAGSKCDFAITSGPGQLSASSCLTAGTTGSCNVALTSFVAGETYVTASTSVTVLGIVLFRATDGIAPNSGPAEASWVDASVQISPATGTDVIGTPHTFTCHVNVNPATGWGNAPAGTECDLAIESGPGELSDSNCLTVGDTGSCTLDLASLLVGTTVVSASTGVTLEEVVLYRETDGIGLNSGNAEKTWVAGSVTLNKTFEAAPSPYPGEACLTLSPTTTSSSVTQCDTGNSLSFSWNDLQAGSYTISETTVPSGYVAMAPIDFTVDVSQLSFTFDRNDPLLDSDNDGVHDVSDNCPLVGNADQVNTDGDSLGDACDPDDDNDGVADVGDNCPLVVNADQVDTDADGLGDACDPDDDNDGVLDIADVCSLEDATGFDADNNGCIDRITDLPTVFNTLYTEGAINSTLWNSLNAKINAAIAASTRDNVCAAVNVLGALKNEITAQTGKKVSVASAQLLQPFITNVQNYVMIVTGNNCN